MTDRIERNSGIAAWRQIADEVRYRLEDYEANGNGRLPSEHTLAEQFGVNRHTVRAAIAALVQEGVLKTEHGKGTFIARAKRLTYPIRKRTRFSAGLADQAKTVGNRLISHDVEGAGRLQSERLGVDEGEPLIRLDTLGVADGVSLSRGTSWFPKKRFADLVDHYLACGSITQSLKLCGVGDYVRLQTSIQARHAKHEDREHLSLSPGAIVLVTHALNVDEKGTAIQFSIVRFAADRITLDVSADT